jgi:uncharacterized protein with NRDE domain
MCTVSIIKTGANGITLTSNRDERITRPTLPPEIKEFHGQRVICPLDVEKGGTWIAASEIGRIVCLLNGGYVKHIPTGKESMSRGRIVLDCFSYDSIQEFVNGIELQKTEPFTMLLIDALQVESLHELIWDGTEKRHTVKNTSTPGLWSSTTLYSEEERYCKKDLFTSIIDESSIEDKSKIFELHSKGIELNGFFLNDSFLRTISITQIEINEEGVSMKYWDFLLDRQFSKQLEWKKDMH